jgi:putative Ca2+/H+ antiporter (TMEM165/GDT1 family)
MDWKAFSSAFVLIFLAELGDKTQLAALGLSATNRSTGSVLLGSLLGIGLATVLGVLAGRWLGQRFNPRYLQWAGGVLFLTLGVLLLLRRGS